MPLQPLPRTPHDPVLPKHPCKIKYPHNQQAKRNANVPPSRSIPSSYIHEITMPNDPIRRSQMPNIANRTCNQVVPRHNRFIGVIQYPKAYEANQAVAVAELESEHLRGRRQRDRRHARGYLGGDEGGGVEEGSDPADDSELRSLARWKGWVWNRSYSEMGSRIVKTMRGMRGRVDAMILRAFSAHHPMHLLSSVSHELV